MFRSLFFQIEELVIIVVTEIPASHLLFNAVSRGNGPILVQQCRTALVQVSGLSPLSERNLPRPSTERGFFAADDPRLRKHPPAAHCNKRNKLNC